MYTEESSQQTFKIPNNNFDVRFEKVYQNHNNEILPTTDQKVKQDKPQFMMVKFQNVMFPMQSNKGETKTNVKCNIRLQYSTIKATNK